MRRLFINATVSVITFVSSIILTNVAKPTIEPVVAPLPVIISMPDESPSEDEMEIRQIFRDYGPAQTRHDRKFFERVEAEEFMLFSSGEKPLTRSEDIKSMNEEPLTDRYELNIIDIKFYDDSAVVNSVMTVLHSDGDTISWPNIDVCVKRNGRWQILSTSQLD